MSSKPTQRVSFFVDGFNLYHSLCSALKKHPERPVKWLDLPALFQSTLHTIQGRCELENIQYFTAYADHLSQKRPRKDAPAGTIGYSEQEGGRRLNH